MTRITVYRQGDLWTWTAEHENGMTGEGAAFSPWAAWTVAYGFIAACDSVQNDDALAHTAEMARVAQGKRERPE